MIIKKYFIIGMIILLMFVYGCGSGEKGEEGDLNYVQGTEGLVVSFMNGMPPDHIYRGDTLLIGINIKNKGTYDLPSGGGTLYLGGFDNSIIKNLKVTSGPSTFIGNYVNIQGNGPGGSLIGRDLYNDQGEMDTTTEIKVSISPDDSINDVIQNINNELNNAGITDVEAKLVNGQLKFVNTSDSGETSKVLVKDDGARLFTALNQIEYLPLNQVNETDMPLPLKNGSFDIVVYDESGNALSSRTITVNMDSKDPKYSTIEGILAQINTPGIDDNGDNNLNNDVDDYYQAEFLNGKLILSKKTDQNTYVGLDNDSADFGGAFGVNKFFDGKDASTIELKREFQEDPSLIKASKTPNSGDNTIANSVLQLQYENINFYVNGNTQSNTIYGFYRGLTSDLAN